MTHEEIDAMPAGPELDALACKAMGIEPHRRMVFTGVSKNRKAIIGHYEDEYVPISTDMAEAIRWMGTKPGMALLYGVDRDGQWLAKTAFPYVDAVGDTPQLAIARAIAKTKEEA